MPLQLPIHPPAQTRLKSTNSKTILRYENAVGLARSLKFNEALKILDILLKDEPTFWQAQLIRARILNEIGKSNVAVESCDAVLKLQPACLSAFDEKAKAQMNLRDYRGAILSLSKLLNQLPSPRNFEQRAIAYKGLSQWEFAIADYQKAQQLYQQRKQLHQARRLTSEIQKLYRHQLKSQFHELEFKKVQRRAITFPFEQGSSSLQIKLLRLLDRDQEKARRLLALMKQKNPTQSVNWCFEKVIHDLERDRSR